MALARSCCIVREPPLGSRGMGASSIRRFLRLYRQEYRRTRRDRRGDQPPPSLKRVGSGGFVWGLSVWLGLAAGGLGLRDALPFGLLAMLVYALGVGALVLIREQRPREAQGG